MKYFIFFILSIYITQGIGMAKEFHYPGKELNGIWQVEKIDLRGVDNINSSDVKDFFNDPTNSSRNSMFLLPVGQKIGFWMTGESHMISPFDRPRSGMDIGMKLIFPLDNKICLGWDFLCDNGKINLNKLHDKNRIKDNSYVAANSDEGMLNFNSPYAKELAQVKKLWPDVKNYCYDVNLDDGLYIFQIYPMKNNNQLLIFTNWVGNRFGVILKKVK